MGSSTGTREIWWMASRHWGRSGQFTTWHGYDRDASVSLCGFGTVANANPGTSRKQRPEHVCRSCRAVLGEVQDPRKARAKVVEEVQVEVVGGAWDGVRVPLRAVIESATRMRVFAGRFRRGPVVERQA